VAGLTHLIGGFLHVLRAGSLFFFVLGVAAFAAHIASHVARLALRVALHLLEFLKHFGGFGGRFATGLALRAIHFLFGVLRSIQVLGLLVHQLADLTLELLDFLAFLAALVEFVGRIRQNLHE